MAEWKWSVPRDSLNKEQRAAFAPADDRMRLNVLQRWWPRPDEQVRNDGEPPQVCPPIVSPDKGAHPVRGQRPATMASDAGYPRGLPIGPTAPPPAKRKGGPRRKQYKVAALRGRERSTPAQLHAAALLYQIANECPELVGSWIRQDELEAWYVEIAAQEGWPPQRWIPIARALKQWTRSRRITRHGKKHTHYRVGSITPALRRRALLACQQMSGGQGR